MQPTYLPWVGYFSLIQSVDYFIFLDDVQYSKQSWQSRNKILISGSPEWLTVPVIKPNGLQTQIRHVLVDDRQKWREKHIEKLAVNYGAHSFFHNISFVNDILLDCSKKNIANININIITAISQYLKIQTKFLLSSSFDIKASRSEKLYLLSNEVNADIYVSPMGSKEYLAEDHFEELYPIKLEFFSHTPKQYPQASSASFIEKLSIYDLLVNCGKSSSDFI